MSTVKEKEKNILILSMSTLHPNMELSHYYGEGANGDYRFDGVSQLEAGTKYLLHHLADKGQKIHRIIVLNTCQTRGEDAIKWDVTRLAPYLHEAESLDAAGFYEKRIREYLQFGDKFVDPEMYLRNAGVDEELAASIRDYLKLDSFSDVEYNNAKGLVDGAEKDVFDAEFKKYVEDKNKIIKEECLSALVRYTNNAGAKNIALEEVIKNYEIQVANASGAIEKEKRAISAFIKEYIYTFLNTHDHFKHKKADNRKALELLYPQVPAELFKHIAVEYKNADGKYIKDETTVKMLCNDLLELKGTAENLHVYIDSQGGDRTFIHTVNAAIDLLSNRNVTVEEIIATNFSRDKLINKVRFVTKDYAITDLGAGMKAFLRYGKAEELLSYLDKKGLGESANEKKLIDIITGIDESIQVSNPVGLYDYLNELKAHPELLDESGYRDVNIKIVVEDIKRDYARLLDQDSDIVDVIEWLCKKSLMIQTLTFIEDKMPGYIVRDSRIIRLAHSYESDYAALVANGWKKNAENRLANGFIKEINGNLLEWDKKEYMKYAPKILLRTYLNAHFEEIAPKVNLASLQTNIDEKSTLWKPCIMSMPVDVLFKKYNADMGLNLQYAAFCSKHKVPQYATVRELVEETKKNDIVAGRISFRPDKLFNETVVAFSEKTYKSGDKRLYESYVSATMAYISSGKMYTSGDKNIVIDLLMDTIFIQAMTDVKNGKKANSTTYEDACECMKLLDIGENTDFSDAIQSDDKVYYKILRILIEDYQCCVNHKEFSIEDYVATKTVDLGQRLATLAEELSDASLSDEEAIEKYVEYRDVAVNYEHNSLFKEQSALYENPLFYAEELGGEFLEVYKNNSVFLYDENYFYQTVAGLRDAHKLGDDIGLDAIHISQSVDRRKLERFLLLHKALKNERNNTNHASEKSLRLPLWVVKRMIYLYIDLAREL